MVIVYAGYTMGFGCYRHSKIAYAKDMWKDIWRVDGHKT